MAVLLEVQCSSRNETANILFFPVLHLFSFKIVFLCADASYSIIGAHPNIQQSAWVMAIIVHGIAEVNLYSVLTFKSSLLSEMDQGADEEHLFLPLSQYTLW